MINGVKNKKELLKAFSILSKQYIEDDKTREKVIGLSREIIKPSKQAIYSIHRDNKSESEKLIKSAEKTITKVDELLKKANLKEVGSFKAGLEEFVEAKTFFHFMYEGKILTPKEFPSCIHYETYLAGLADMTGELSKKTVTLATKGSFEDVQKINDCIEEINLLFLSMDFRSGELRKKSESIKYNLSKVENILYDISIRKR